MTTPAWIDDLTALCDRATPGPWVPEDRDWGVNNGVVTEDVNGGVSTVHNHGTTSITRFVAVPAHDHSCEIGSETHRNMEFIATFNPATVLRLLTMVQECEEALKHIVRPVEHGDCCSRAFHEDNLDNHMVDVARLALVTLSQDPRKESE